MLVGTTFAWFTDTVSSGRNVIKSGTLKVNLQYSKDYNTWTDVGSSTKLFDENALWEPGHTEIVYLKVENAGNLALKYQLFANIYNETAGTNVKGASFKLSDYIKVGTIKDVTEKYSRENAISAITTPVDLNGGFEVTTGNLSAKTTSDTSYPSDTLALVVYMPTDVGNDANYDGTHAPKIDIGVILQATQYTEESDSFGTDYDEDAQYESDLEVGSTISASSVTENVKENEDTVLTAADGNVVITVPKADTTNKKSVTANITPVTSTTAGITIKSGDASTTYNIEVLADGQKLENTSAPITVKLFVGYGLSSGVTIYHKTEKIDSTYDSETGMVTFSTNSFSPFTAVFTAAAKIGKTYYASLQEAVTAAQDGNKIVVQRDISTVYRLIHMSSEKKDKKITVDLKGHTLNYTGSDRAVQIGQGANLTIKNGKINALDASNGAILAFSSSSLDVENVTVNAKKQGIYSDKETTTKLKDVNIKVDRYGVNCQKAKSIEMDNVNINIDYVYTDETDTQRYGVLCYSNITAELKNVTIKSDGRGICCEDSINATLDNVNIKAGNIGIICAGSNNNISINKSNITSKYFGLYQNGSNSPSKFKVENSTITDTAWTGIYISNSADKEKQTLEIKKSIIKGPTAVEVKHTDATITDSKLVATSTEEFYVVNDSGSCTKGYSIAVTTNVPPTTHTPDDTVTGSVKVENSKLCSMTEDNDNGKYFVYTLSEDANVTINGQTKADITITSEYQHNPNRCTDQNQ
jgi:predicted ribosomally synthesized peptide with SipW-like signal peptide